MRTMKKKYIIEFEYEDYKHYLMILNQLAEAENMANKLGLKYTRQEIKPKKRQ